MNFAKLLYFLNYTDHSYYDLHVPSKTAIKTEYISDEKTDIQYIIRVYKSRILVAFRGTDSCKDVFSDLNFLKKTAYKIKNYRKIRIHRGFLNAYTKAKIADRIVPNITKDIKTISFTGHSYGGALSIICAADLFRMFPNIEYEIVVFGAPRIGNKGFANFFNDNIPNTIRIENGNDIITKLPPPIFGFVHVGKNYHIGTARSPFLFSFIDHAMSKYRKNLLK